VKTPAPGCTNIIIILLCEFWKFNVGLIFYSIEILMQSVNDVVEEFRGILLIIATKLFVDSTQDLFNEGRLD